MESRDNDRHSEAPMWIWLVLSLVGGTWLGPPAGRPESLAGRVVRGIALVFLAAFLLAIAATLIYVVIDALRQ